MNMRLLGARTIAEVVPSMVDARALESHSSVPNDTLFGVNCACFVLRLSSSSHRVSDECLWRPFSDKTDESLGGTRLRSKL